jgi:hypothetical protein
MLLVGAMPLAVFIRNKYKEAQDRAPRQPKRPSLLSRLKKRRRNCARRGSEADLLPNSVRLRSTSYQETPAMGRNVIRAPPCIFPS